MLWAASHRGKLEVVKYLVDRGSNIDACGSHYTPYFVEVSCLCIATHKKRRAVAQFLDDAGAKNNIHMAAFLGQLDSVKKFLARSRRRINLGHKQHVMAGPNEDGLEFIPKSANWATPLCYALRGGDLQTASFLVDSGAVIRGFEREMFIAADEKVDMVRLLLENGADPSFAPTTTPDDSELYELVTSYGVEMSKDELNEELVYLCRGDRGGNPNTVRQMLKDGADVDHQDKKGKTALHRSAKAGFVETAEILLDAGASVYIRDINDETPLFDVARSTIKKTDRQMTMIDLLVKAGADVGAKNRKGQSCYDVAKKSEVKQRLKRPTKK